ncbi:hypothetical protein F8388_009630 [Cannabis sativa]|uniref:Cupin type-1 domain-containing protein n=1 Tax=Cannabis sativa TaxID=3483 RepID=A0A7J6EAA7_CANSA|nr:hypothetical protein F8388_009630 [Cannabis sativa]
MGRIKLTLLVLMLVLSYGVLGIMGFDEDEDWTREKERKKEEEREKEKEREDERGELPFILRDSKHVMKTDAGEMRVMRSSDSKFAQGPLRIGFITMEPKTLFLPQYLDSELTIFIRRGEVKLGFIYKDQLAERKLKTGDVYRISAGSAFYLVNTGEGQRLHIICSFDTSESLRIGTFQLKQEDKLQHLKKIVGFHQGEEEEEDEEELEEDINQEQNQKTTWSWRKLLDSLFANRDKKTKDYKGKGKSPDSYNLYDGKKGFKNNYGWSIALDEFSYSPLRKSGCGVYLVNLTAGSMMAPHLNPKATEYGIVLKGTGMIQVVYPNGTSAMNTEVKEGDVFWVPRYFPFCQIASRAGPMEFFGFTTSARKNRPQFLVGASSILRSMRGPELAAAFGLSLERLGNLTSFQRESVILPTSAASPPVKLAKPIRSLKE